MIRILCVKEQEYIFCCSPFSLCVSNEGSKGFVCNCFNIFVNFASIIEESFISLFDDLMKCFSKTSFSKLFFPVSDCFHCFFYGLKLKGIRVFIDFKNSLNEHFMLLFSRDKKTYIISHLLNPSCGKLGKHCVDIGYCICFHNKIVNKKRRYVNGRVGEHKGY